MDYGILATLIVGAIGTASGWYMAWIGNGKVQRLEERSGSLNVEHQRHVTKILKHVHHFDMVVHETHGFIKDGGDIHSKAMDLATMSLRLGDINTTLRTEVLHLLAKTIPNATPEYVDELVQEGALDPDNNEDGILRGFLRADDNSQD